MKKKYYLKYLSDYDIPSGFNQTNLFTIKAAEQKGDEDEFSKIISKYEKKYKKQISWALLRLGTMIKKRGIQLDQFINESEDGNLPVYKLTETGSLRLYFIISDDITIIFGGGGEKFVKRWQDDPVLSKILYALCDLIKEVDRHETIVTKENCEELIFEIELED